MAQEIRVLRAREAFLVPRDGRESPVCLDRAGRMAARVPLVCLESLVRWAHLDWLASPDHVD